MMHLDTSYLVDLLREGNRGKPGPATALLDSIQGEQLRVGVHVICELLAGAELARRPAVERQRVHHLCAGVEIVYPDRRFPIAYAQLLAALERAHQRISTMDLLIATAALVGEAPLVTRNTRDFSRVPGLSLVAY